MAVKSLPSKKAAALPPGLKSSSRPASAKLRKLLMEDRAIASGGRNIIHRRKPASRAAIG